MRAGNQPLAIAGVPADSSERVCRGSEGLCCAAVPRAGWRWVNVCKCGIGYRKGDLHILVFFSSMNFSRNQCPWWYHILYWYYWLWFSSPSQSVSKQYDSEDSCTFLLARFWTEPFVVSSLDRDLICSLEHTFVKGMGILSWCKKCLLCMFPQQNVEVSA